MLPVQFSNLLWVLVLLGGFAPECSCTQMQQKVIKQSGIEQNLIAVMGATGAGKSRFINTVLENDELKVGEGLGSCTSAIQQASFEMDGQVGMFIDTPGFDDTHLTDTEVLEYITKWMGGMYAVGVKFTGILFLRDIGEVKMKGTEFKNLLMFRELCGTDSLRNVVLVTTKWNTVPRKQAEKREEELISEYFRPMIDWGARVARDNGTVDSARAIIRQVLGMEKIVLDIQHEIVDEGKALRDTRAGKQIAKETTQLQRKYEEAIKDLKNQHEKEQSELGKKIIREQEAQTVAKLKKAKEDLERLEKSRKKEIEELHKMMEQLRQQNSDGSFSKILDMVITGFDITQILAYLTTLLL